METPRLAGDDSNDALEFTVTARLRAPGAPEDIRDRSLSMTSFKQTKLT